VQFTSLLLYVVGAVIRVLFLSPHSTNQDSGSTKTAKEKLSDTLARVYGAVCFGYGAFNLCVSMVPQHLLRVVNVIGFSGDKDVGLRCLEVACESKDMKAPLAM